MLPLLQTLIPQHLLTERLFFAGYGAAQAMPGPLFTIASFVGAANDSPLYGALGALVATVTIFAPSFALLFALAPVWNRIVALPRAGGALRGANASVVGLLGAVLYDPVLLALGSGPLRSCHRHRVVRVDRALARHAGRRRDRRGARRALVHA